MNRGGWCDCCCKNVDASAIGAKVMLRGIFCFLGCYSIYAAVLHAMKDHVAPRVPLMGLCGVGFCKRQVCFRSTSVFLNGSKRPNVVSVEVLPFIAIPLATSPSIIDPKGKTDLLGLKHMVRLNLERWRQRTVRYGRPGQKHGHICWAQQLVFVLLAFGVAKHSSRAPQIRTLPEGE